MEYGRAIEVDLPYVEAVAKVNRHSRRRGSAR